MKLELVAAREAMLAGQGQEAEYKRLFEQKMEEERDSRLAHLQRVGIHRLTQIQKSRAWNTWLECYAEQVEKKRLLRGAALNLMKPKLASGFRHWHADWSNSLKAIESRQAADEVNQKVLDEIKKREAIELQLRKMRVDNEQQLELQRVAIAEARQSAMDALSRSAIEKAAADEARKAAKDAAERFANQSAETANTLLEQQQTTALLSWHSCLLAGLSSLEIVKLREEYEKIIASLRLESSAATKKPDPPPPCPIAGACSACKNRPLNTCV